MSAHAIAVVLDDLMHHRERVVLLDDSERGDYNRRALAAINAPVVVDATAIYDSIVEGDREIYVYEDHPCIAPPFESFAVCYVNGHGNVHAMHGAAIDYRGSEAAPWETPNVVEWERVRWVISVHAWCGGRTSGTNTSRPGPMPTFGPAHAWAVAVYDDGQPADIRWFQFGDEPLEAWDNPGLVLLGALNFLNCRNVELVEPHHTRAEHRRIERTGVRVHTIMVTPTSRGGRSAGNGAGMLPLTSVRGHFSHYGACCAYHEPRGLLFGKLEGRYWVPQHARGSAEHGESKADYKLDPGAS